MTLVSVDAFLGKKRRGDSYNCLHLAREAWLAITGQDIGERLQALHETAANRRVHRSDVAAFTSLPAPIEPCIVLLRSNHDGPPHVGVYVRGKVLHLGARGVRYERLDLAMVGFSSVRYYQ